MAAELRSTVGKAEADGLHGCVDYVLFPLLLGVDSIAATRQQPESPLEAGGGSELSLAMPGIRSDAASEALLSCLAALLQRRLCDNSEQVLGVLHRLAVVLALPPGAASEEASAPRSLPGRMQFVGTWRGHAGKRGHDGVGMMASVL